MVSREVVKIIITHDTEIIKQKSILVFYFKPCLSRSQIGSEKPLQINASPMQKCVA